MSEAHSKDFSGRFFTGIEVERTPMYGQKTLFVVGTPNVEDIEKCLDGTDIKHIYFGANQSFSDDGDTIVTWHSSIIYFLSQGFWCTLDFDISEVDSVTDFALDYYNTFIPMISAKIPYLNQLGYNAVLKIDDTGFGRSNPGVWCHMLHDLQDRDVFTHWSAYKDDKPLCSTNN